jgi:hypothetical protein
MSTASASDVEPHRGSYIHACPAIAAHHQFQCTHPSRKGIMNRHRHTLYCVISLPNELRGADLQELDLCTSPHSVSHSPGGFPAPSVGEPQQPTVPRSSVGGRAALNPVKSPLVCADRRSRLQRRSNLDHCSSRLASNCNLEIACSDLSKHISSFLHAETPIRPPMRRQTHAASPRQCSTWTPPKHPRGEGWLLALWKIFAWLGGASGWFW